MTTLLAILVWVALDLACVAVTATILWHAQLLPSVVVWRRR